jgi:lactose/L-arabinose transport system ATP-binding protein
VSELVLKALAKTYGDTEILSEISLAVEHGEFVVFVGPSGCGKSTLLRMIAGLEKVSVGEIWLDGNEVTHLPPSARSVAMVFQNYALYPHMTVADNIGFGLRMAGVDKTTRRAKVEEVAKILRLEVLLNRKPRELSGGQRQRVAIGRAIVKHPRLFLFDEPLSNLDAELRTEMRVELAKLHRSTNATMIYVTHDQTEAMTMADRIVVLRGGRIEQVGRPVDLYEDPDNCFVASFIGSPKINIFEISDGRAPSIGDLPFPGSLLPGTHGVGIRPEHVRHAPTGLSYTGIVEIVERLGHAAYLYVRAAGGALVSVLEQKPGSVNVGDPISMEFSQERLLMFGADGARIRSCAPILP